MSCQLKIGDLYATPKYRIGLYQCKVSIQNILKLPNGVVNKYGMFYIPSPNENVLPPETPFTLLNVERVRNDRRGIVHLFKILTITGSMGWVCLFVPNDCKQLKPST